MKTQEKKYTEIKSNFFHLLSENSREKKKCCFYKCDVFQCGKMCVDASKFAVMQLNV